MLNYSFEVRGDLFSCPWQAGISDRDFLLLSMADRVRLLDRLDREAAASLADFEKQLGPDL